MGQSQPSKEGQDSQNQDVGAGTLILAVLGGVAITSIALYFATGGSTKALFKAKKKSKKQTKQTKRRLQYDEDEEESNEEEEVRDNSQEQENTSQNIELQQQKFIIKKQDYKQKRRIKQTTQSVSTPQQKFGLKSPNGRSNQQKQKQARNQSEDDFKRKFISGAELKRKQEQEKKPSTVRASAKINRQVFNFKETHVSQQQQSERTSFQYKKQHLIPEYQDQNVRTSPSNQNSSRFSLLESMNVTEDTDEEGHFIEHDIKLQYDNEGILSLDTIIQIFDKRGAMRGLRKLKQCFRQKRRAILSQQRDQDYKKTCIDYNKAIESKREENLRYVCNRLKIGMDQIEQAQEKYIMGTDMTFVLGVKEFLKCDPPQWLTYERALEVFSEISELRNSYQQEIENQMAQSVDYGGGEMDDQTHYEESMLVATFKILDIIYFQYKIEEEHVKHVIYRDFKTNQIKQ